MMPFGKTLDKKLVIIATLVFVAVNALAIANEFFWVPVLPLALGIVYLALFRTDRLFYLVLFCVPLSINFEKLNFGVGVIMPTEPILFGMMILFILRLFLNGYNKEVLKHPITILIIVQFIWYCITTLTSELPLVSFKFMVARLWFLSVFYFIAAQIIDEPKKIHKFFWIYIIPMLMVVTYTIIHHATYGFEEKPGHWVMSPFFKDHTSYGAVLAMLFPFVFGKAFEKDVIGYKRFIYIILTVIMTVAIVLSYTRAAWVSLVIGLIVYIVFRYRVPIWFLCTLVAGMVVGFFIFQSSIFQKLEKNRTDSSSNLSEHVKSISNVSSDASNLERINRWSCAVRMYEERPITGWGPGTYAFLYAPFQQAKNKTIISTNAGDGGNAHSEYLGPLAEAGAFALITMVALLFMLIYYGFKINNMLEAGTDRFLFYSVYVGLVTYLVHGTLNNYLDTDKASSLFWGFLAFIVMFDIKYSKIKKEKEELEELTA